MIIAAFKPEADIVKQKTQALERVNHRRSVVEELCTTGTSWRFVDGRIHSA